MYSSFQLAKKYLAYQLTASNGKGHGVHSPFVFDFIKSVLNDKKPYDCYAEIEKIRKKLLRNKKIIEVEDFGAGSSVIKTNSRVINKMAVSSLKPKKYAQLLYRMVKYYQPKTIAELGTSFGTTTAYLASGHSAARLYTLEGATAIAAVAQQNFDILNLKNIILLLGSFEKTLPLLFAETNSIGFVFIDGNHREAPTIEYFNRFLGIANQHTIFIFDDIHWSRGMEAAWNAIKKHELVTLTIDLFFMGIVFLKKDFKVKQHFSIRF
ncbi:MAG: class I SAM-dependent methyltransferase [Ferruginibacter sp.]